MRRLLLIDDDDTTREVLALLLAADGWAVTEACSGGEAVALASSTTPEVILSDLQMPGLHGSALAHALREACNGATVLLAMTATRLPAAPEGFDALLIKPFDAAAVREAALGAAATPANPHAGAAAKPVLAPGTFRRMAASMPAAQLRALYDFALTDAEGRVARMDVAAAAGDDVTLRSEAHALKGSAGMIGALRLQTLAANAEATGLTESSVISTLIADFYAEIAEVRSMLGQNHYSDN